MMNIDVTLFHSVNDWAGRSRFADAVMIAAARGAPALYAGLLVACWLTWRPRAQRAAAVAGLSALLALGVGQLIGLAFPRPRPYEVIPAHVLIAHAPDTSFPSDHAILVGAVTIALWSLSRRLRAVLIGVGVLVLVSRVFIGVHYPSDVLGGAVLGAATAASLSTLLTKHKGASRVFERGFGLLRRLRVAAPEGSPGTP